MGQLNAVNGFRMLAMQNENARQNIPPLPPLFNDFIPPLPPLASFNHSVLTSLPPLPPLPDLKKKQEGNDEHKLDIDFDQIPRFDTSLMQSNDLNDSCHSSSNSLLSVPTLPQILCNENETSPQPLFDGNMSCRQQSKKMEKWKD